MKGENDDEIDSMVAFCQQHGFILRLIEAMPMGDTGRNTPISRPAAGCRPAEKPKFG